ncbi:hypothetical protein JW935_00170 [candidate division KSB1 bacterium]|nr:hypothetical protein [candidate division KSB1 bacterium]
MKRIYVFKAKSLVPDEYQPKLDKKEIQSDFPNYSIITKYQNDSSLHFGDIELFLSSTATAIVNIKNKISSFIEQDIGMKTSEFAVFDIKLLPRSIFILGIVEYKAKQKSKKSAKHPTREKNKGLLSWLKLWK